MLWHLADLLADLSAAGSLPPKPRCLDLGAGAGLPGVPLRLFWPHGDYLLVEPRHKRSAFLRVAVATLGLMGTAVFPGRVEELPPERLPADLVLARAFLPWPELLELASRLLALRGMVVAFAHDPEPDAERIPDGWRFVCGRSYSSPEGSRSFWVFTPASTPR